MLDVRTAHALFGLSSLLNPEGSRLFPYFLMLPRHPGKPDPRWITFDWKYLDENQKGAQYRLFFYQQEEKVVEFVLPKINEQISYLSQVFNYTPSQKFSYLLLGSRREFSQIHIFNITEGVQGITSTTERTMAIPFWGEVETFRHISTHELTHQFEIQKVEDLVKKRNDQQNSQMVLGALPLWFIEGKAEYYSLNGMDPESRQYVRDLLLYPNPEKDYKIPKFFEQGQLNFVQVYKMGQARIDFLESTYGKGISQRILDFCALNIGLEIRNFEQAVIQVLRQSSAEIEKKWITYLNQNYKEEANHLTQPMTEFEEIKGVGEYADSFTFSPDGKLIAVRQIDPLTGVTSIILSEFDHLDQKIQVASDHEADYQTLYYMQAPILSLSNTQIAYIIGSTHGPELEIRKINRDSHGHVKLSNPRRIFLYLLNLIEASSPAFSPNGKSIALVGLEVNGWQKVFEIDISEQTFQTKNVTYKKLTDGNYSWKSLIWNEDGLIGASDQTTHGKYNIFQIIPNGGVRQVSYSKEDQLSPSGDNLSHLVFQSWNNRTSQIHQIKDGIEYIITDAKVGLSAPILRQGELYSLGLQGGRFRVFHIQKQKWLNQRFESIRSEHQTFELLGETTPWRPKFIPLPQSNILAYRPFFSSGGIRLDDLGAFFSTGTIGGLSVSVSDLMRDYTASAQVAYIGQYGLTDTFFLFGAHKGRSSWNTGMYSILQPRVDNLYSQNNVIRTFLQREYGLLGAYQYPLGVFSYLDIGLRLAGVSRNNYSDQTYSLAWETINPGTEFMAAPVFRIGYDNILYEIFAGPLRGYGVLIETDTSFYPKRGSINERLRFDFSYYFQPIGNSVLAFQALLGTSFGDIFGNSFLLSSDDILRGYPVLDSRLFGNYVMASKIEYRFPIGSLFKFPMLRGLFAFDYGSIFRKPSEMDIGLSSSYSTGLSLNVPPLSINFIISYPGVMGSGESNGSVVHFLLRYLYL